MKPDAVLTKQVIAFDQRFKSNRGSPLFIPIVKQKGENRGQIFRFFLCLQVVHEEIADVIEKTQAHEAVHSGLEFEQNDDIKLPPLQFNSVDNVALSFFVVVSDKGFIELLARIKIDIFDPFFGDKRFDELAEDTFVAEELLIAGVMNVRHVFPWSVSCIKWNGKKIKQPTTCP